MVKSNWRHSAEQRVYRRNIWAFHNIKIENVLQVISFENNYCCNSRLTIEKRTGRSNSFWVILPISIWLRFLYILVVAAQPNKIGDNIFPAISSIRVIQITILSVTECILFFVCFVFNPCTVGRFPVCTKKKQRPGTSTYLPKFHNK